MERPEMKIAKKSWSEPALLVLVRGKPEEAVLDVSKTSASSPGGFSGSALYANNICNLTNNGCQFCASYFGS